MRYQSKNPAKRNPMIALIFFIFLTINIYKIDVCTIIYFFDMVNFSVTNSPIFLPCPTPTSTAALK